jgi:hypothetical protein
MLRQALLHHHMSTTWQQLRTSRLVPELTRLHRVGSQSVSWIALSVMAMYRPAEDHLVGLPPAAEHIQAVCHDSWQHGAVSRATADLRSTRIITVDQVLVISGMPAIPC